jgi:GNAT superfamily N-acetyltransferase
MMRRFLSSLLRPKKALDALLDTMADGLNGHDNYDELGGHGGRDGLGRDPYLPENKGTEFSKQHDVVIPSSDLHETPDPASAEFFKESEPKTSAFEVEAAVDPRIKIKIEFQPIPPYSERGAKSRAYRAVAMLDGKEVGHLGVGLSNDGTEAQIGLAEIDDSQRRTGLGQAMYDKAIAQAKKMGCSVFRSDTSLSDDAHKAWGRLGQRYPVERGREGYSIRLDKEGHSFEQEQPNFEPVEEEMHDHEFFKEAPEFEMTSKGIRRVGSPTKEHSPEWDAIQNILSSKGYNWLGRVSDGTEMWGNAKERVVYDPATKTWEHQVGGKADQSGVLEELESKLSAPAPHVHDWRGIDTGRMCATCGETEKQATVRGPEPKKSAQVIPNGTRVNINSPGHWDHDGWGIVTMFDGENYHVAMYGDTKTQPIFSRSELKVPKKSALKACVACECGDCIEHHGLFPKAASRILYHVTQTAKVPKIKEQGIIPLQSSNWVKGKSDERYGEGEIYACDNLRDAVRWGAKMDWDFNHEMGSGKISLIAFEAGDAKWEVDDNDPIQQMQNKGHWLKHVGHVKPAQITKVVPITLAMTRAVVQGQEPEFEKEGDMVSYGMGQPLGGSDNPAGGEDDENADDDQNTGLGGLDMTSSQEDDEYDPYDYEAEDDKLAAAMDAEDDECDSRARFWAHVVDGDDFENASSKISSTEEYGWFSKSARPTDQKIELLTKQFKLTPEQIEECIKADPSPNQSDFVGWLAKWWSKGNIHLPEDSERMKGQLDLFQRYKKSPQFTFNKDIQQYDPVKLFETLEQAGTTMLSKKEQKREQVRKGADIVVQSGDITIYRVTEPSAAVELGGGTNWCTAASASTAKSYLEDGPLYIFFDSGSAVAQLSCPSNMFMNRQDVCILESVTGDDSSYGSGRNVKKFLADPALAKSLQLLAEKQPDVAEWAKKSVADPDDVKKILGEAAAKEIEQNTEYEKEVAQYKIELAEYEKKRQAIQPAVDKWQKKYQEYQTKLNEYYEKQQRGDDPGERPVAPKNRPEEPRRPYDPSAGYNSGGYRDRYQTRGKKFTMQVRNALATGQALPPETEMLLPESGVSNDLLIKYGSLFHPGQPWEPLAQALLKNVQSRGMNKNAIDYAAKFVKGAWPPLEPYLLTKLFLQTRNMENMRFALDYAIRARKTRWPEFEAALAKAKPGRASGYGAAEYAIRVLKQPWSKFPDVKRKKNGKINAEECMIVGNPPEAKRYADTFGSGERWTDFEQKALEANNLVALIQYMAGQKQRMPELEEKILSGEKDAQESKGGRRNRYRAKTDLPLLYSEEVIKGRWPEYEQKMLGYVKALDKTKGYGYDEYTPSTSETRNERHWNRGGKLDSRVSDYITRVIKGRWPELEQVLLGRYAEHPETWVQNQNVIDGYLSSIDQACQQRYEAEKQQPAADEDEEEKDTRPTLEQINNPRPRPDKRKIKPFTPFTQDQQCYWPEGEQRLITRDPGYEKILIQVLYDRAQPAKTEEEKGNKSWIKEGERYVAPEDLKNVRPPEGKERFEYDDPNKPDYTIYKGLYISTHGMGEMEKYVGYFHANGVAVPELEDILEVAEDLEDAQGRWTTLGGRPRWKGNHQPAPKVPEQQELPLQEQAQGATASMKKKFQSSLLRKQALVDMHESPTMLPPRTDIRRHMDEDEQLALTDDVREGINPNTLKPPINQIDPRINPDGVVASKKIARVDAAQIKHWAESVPGFIANLHVEPVEGALRIDYKGKPIGYMGIPLEQLFEVIEPYFQQGLNKSDEEIWDHIMAPYGGQQQVFNASKEAANPNLTVKNWRRTHPKDPIPEAERRPIDPFIEWWVEEIRQGRTYNSNLEEARAAYNESHGKQADYTDQDWMDDEAAEYSLDQVRDAEKEAKRHFMEEDYIQQLSYDYIPPKSMEEMWDIMGEEYTAEFYGYPYKRVQDFTDQPEPEGGWEGHRITNDSTGNAGRFASERCPLCKSANVRGVDGGTKTASVFAECLDCRGFYTLLSH